MKYLETLYIPTESTEVGYIIDPHTMMQTSYDYNNAYPFKIFPFKHLSRIDFEPITIFCGGNGSGKSTLLNIIAEKLKINRTTPFNKTPFWDDYLSFCQVDLAFGKHAPRDSEFIASDDVFDNLLNRRRQNDSIARKRTLLEDEYKRLADPNKPPYQLSSLDNLDEFKLHNEVRRKSRSEFTRNRLPKFEDPEDRTARKLSQFSRIRSERTRFIYSTSLKTVFLPFCRKSFFRILLTPFVFTAVSS